MTNILVIIRMTEYGSNLRKNCTVKGLTKKSNFFRVPYLQIFAPGAALSWFWTYQGPISPNFCARRSVMMILNLSESLAKPLVMAKRNMAYLSSLKNQQNCCRPTCRCHHLGYSVPPALHRTIWCRSTFGPRGPGLSNPTSFLRPALPMAPTRDDNARDKRSVLRPNPATFLRDFALNMTTNYTIIRKRYLKGVSHISKFLRSAQRYHDFKLIRVPYLQIFAPGAALWWF